MSFLSKFLSALLSLRSLVIPVAVIICAFVLLRRQLLRWVAVLEDRFFQSICARFEEWWGVDFSSKETRWQMANSALTFVLFSASMVAAFLLAPSAGGKVMAAPALGFAIFAFLSLVLLIGFSRHFKRHRVEKTVETEIANLTKTVDARLGRVVQLLEDG